MNTLMTNIEHIERMMVRAEIIGEGLIITFADGCNGLIPFDVIPEVGGSSNVVNIELPNMYQVNIHHINGELIELPWDFLRHYCDVDYRPKIEAIAFKGRQTLGKLIREIREKANMTQVELARTAGISRITEVRIENGEQSPRYKTLVAISQALKYPIAELVSGVSPVYTELDMIQVPKPKAELSAYLAKREEVTGAKGAVQIARFKIEEALRKAMGNDWETSVRLLKEAEILEPNDYDNDVEAGIKMVWLCIQKTSIGPLIIRAEKSITDWDYKRATDLLEDISSILVTMGFPLDYDDYSLRVANIASAACGAADRWQSTFALKLDRTLIGISVVKTNTEALIENMVTNKGFRF